MMIKLFKRVLVLVVACVIAAGTFAFAACDNGKDDGSVNENGAKIASLEVENQRTQFKLGDPFEYGEGFTVWAIYDDGSKIDVTSNADVRQEAGLDTSVAGDYQITVRYGGLIADYKIYVSDFKNILRKIDLDTTAVKTMYNLGDAVSFEGLKLICTYQNAQGTLVEEEVTSLKDFNVEIKHENGTVYTETLSVMGDYTVTIFAPDATSSSQTISASYKITVVDVDLTSVKSALDVGAAFVGEVLSGTEAVVSSLHENPRYDEFYYIYEFGQNYTYVRETKNTPVNELHLSLEEDGTLFCVNMQGSNRVAHGYSNADMVQGPTFLLWYQSQTEYGVENALANLYENAASASNGDFKQTADENSREYAFSYSGLYYSSNQNSRDYYEIKVTFKLGGRYNVEHAEIEMGYWENNEGFKGGEGYVPSFITDEVTGKTTPNIECSKFTKITVDQAAGERTKTNPYNADELTVSSFDIAFNGKTLEDGETIEWGMTNRQLTLNIINIQPTTADFRQDALYLNYVGSKISDVNSSTAFVHGGVSAFRSNNAVRVLFDHGGEWEFVLKTKNVTKTVKFKVTGIAPTSMKTSVFNTLSGEFYDSEEETVIVGRTVIFYGEVNEYADSQQRADIISENAALAEISETRQNNVYCYSFTATAAGEYKIKITSTADLSITSELTVTVVAAPVMSELLTGDYTTQDAEGNIFDVSFTPASTTGNLSGTVTITKTPTVEDTGEILTAEAKTQTLSYSVNAGEYVISLEGVSGDNLGVLLAINPTGNLVIEDQYGYLYKLERPSGN